MDPHTVLGIRPGATVSEIQGAWRRLAKQYHPDRLQHLPPGERDEAEHKLREINAAYEALKPEGAGLSSSEPDSGLDPRGGRAGAAVGSPTFGGEPPEPAAQDRRRRRRRRRRSAAAVVLLAGAGVVVVLLAAGPGGGGGSGGSGGSGGGEGRLPAGTVLVEPIGYGEERSGQLSRHRDVKVFPFAGAAGETVRIVMARDELENGIGMYLLDPNGREMASSADSSLPSGGRETDIGPLPLPATGTYKIVAGILLDQPTRFRMKLVKLSG